MKMHTAPFLILLTLGLCQAAPAQQIVVDEDGNGMITFTNMTGMGLTNSLLPDPGPGGGAAVLTYQLPFNTVVGDVALVELGTNNIASDFIRFNGNTLVFYSDATTNDVELAKADGPPPGAFYTNRFVISEVGPEAGLNGVFPYTPAAGQPGFVPGQNVSYTIISDPGTIITVDETGKGTITFTNLTQNALTNSMLPDPGPDGSAAALTYQLPFNTVVGDVILTEPPGNTNSDLIRFNGNTLVFYSDTNATDVADSKADGRIPNLFYANLFTFAEMGPEAGPNGFTYTPLAGQPGFVPGQIVTYKIISDPVPVPLPEPFTSIVSVVALGGTGLWMLRRRRNA